MNQKLTFEEKYNLLTGRIFMAGSRYLNQNFKNNSLAITREQWTVLASLWQKDGVAQQWIADQTGRDKPSTTRLIDNLEKLGYLKRKADKKDRRSNLIFLTDLGKSIKEDVEKSVDKTIDDMTIGINEKDLETIRKVFKQIYINIENQK